MPMPTLQQIIGTITGKVAFERTQANFTTIKDTHNALEIVVGTKAPNADLVAHKAENVMYAVFSMSANQSIPSATDTQIFWGLKTPYNGENFCDIDVATGKIKILKTGMYQLQTQIDFTGRQGGIRSYWGTVLNSTFPSDTSRAYMIVTELVNATAGQLLNSRVTQTTSTPLDLSAGVTKTLLRKVG